MGDRLGILSAVGFYFLLRAVYELVPFTKRSLPKQSNVYVSSHTVTRVNSANIQAHTLVCEFTPLTAKRDAPGEARTHGLQIMRLTRCLLRYGGSVLRCKPGMTISLIIFMYIAAEEKKKISA